MKRSVNLYLHHQIVVFLSEILDGYKIGDGRVIYQNINRSIDFFSFLNQVFPVLTKGQIRPDGVCFAAGIALPCVRFRRIARDLPLPIRDIQPDGVRMRPFCSLFPVIAHIRRLLSS